jgi:hypothetical protein
LTTNRLSLAVALDDACEQIHDAWRAGHSPTTIALGPALFETVRRARRQELAAGGQLLLLDLHLVEDDRLVGDAVRVV